MPTPASPPSKQQLLYADLCVELKFFAKWDSYIECTELPETFLKAAKFLQGEWNWLQEKLLSHPKNKELKIFQTKLKLKEEIFKERLVSYIQTSIENKTISEDIQNIFDTYLKNLNKNAYMGSTYIYYINEMAPEKNSYVFCTIAEDSTENKLDSLKKQFSQYFQNETNELERKLVFLEFTQGHYYEVSSLLKNKNDLDQLNKLLKHHNYKLKVTASTEEPIPNICQDSQSVIHAIDWCEENTEAKALVKYMTRIKNKLNQNIAYRQSGITSHPIPASGPDFFPKKAWA